MQRTRLGLAVGLYRFASHRLFYPSSYTSISRFVDENFDLSFYVKARVPCACTFPSKRYFLTHRRVSITCRYLELTTTLLVYTRFQWFVERDSIDEKSIDENREKGNDDVCPKKFD